MTTYRDRVKAICDTLGIVYPIQENDLTVAAFSFCINGNWEKTECTNRNRAGRAFFQYSVQSTKGIPDTTVINGLDRLKETAEGHFGEKWHDAEEKKRRMLIAFKQADAVRVHWKT